MESFHQLVTAHVKAQQKAAFDFDQGESEANIVGIANAIVAMEKQLKTLGDER